LRDWTLSYQLTFRQLM